MDYGRFYSDDVASFFRSPVREIFKKVDLSSIYSFAGGYPSADTFPVEAIKKAFGTVLEKYGAKCFQYGATQGVPELRNALSARFGVPEANIQISTSSQQGIDVCTRVLVNPGDIVLTTAPAYLGALQSFRSYRADVRTFDPQNIPDAVKFFYVVPDFCNPSGETLTLAQREQIIALAREKDFLILEDSPYRELRYEGDDVPTMYSLAPDRVIHLGSFSKVLAPGFRLGWIFGPEEILDRIYVCKQSLDLCPPMMEQYLACELLTNGALDENLAHSIALYRRKRDTMLSSLEKQMPAGVRWTHPEGGLFIYLTLPEHIDTVALYDQALSAGVAYVAGRFFSPEGTAGSKVAGNTMRLNFSFMDEERIPEGIELLAKLLILQHVD